MIAGVVLAAGGSSRFGATKALAPFRGRPLIRWPIDALIEAGLDEVIVVVGANAAAIEAELAGVTGCRTVRCPLWPEGQSRSLQTGLDAADGLGADAVVLVLADQPLLQAAAVTRVVAHRDADSDAVRATYDGVDGHPVLLEKRLWPALHAIDGDQGARKVLDIAAVRAVPCDGLGSAADVDTAEDLERLSSGS